MSKRSTHNTKKMRPMLRGLSPAPKPYWRPKTRADCVDEARPCPYAGCRHHLWLNVTRAGSITFVGSDGPGQLNQMDDTCALDVAERGQSTRPEIGRLLGLHVSQLLNIEQTALLKLAAHEDVREP